MATTCRAFHTEDEARAEVERLISTGTPDDDVRVLMGEMFQDRSEAPVGSFAGEAGSVGSFADPSFPPPTRSSYDSRRHDWVVVPDTIERDEAWEALVPFYESGQYAEVADRGQELIETNPRSGRLLYNVACCESIIGRNDDAIEHLRRAIEVHEPLRTLAANDSDFDPIRDEPAFRGLVGS